MKLLEALDIDSLIEEDVSRRQFRDFIEDLIDDMDYEERAEAFDEIRKAHNSYRNFLMRFKRVLGEPNEYIPGLGDVDSSLNPSNAGKVFSSVVYNLVQIDKVLQKKGKGLDLDFIDSVITGRISIHHLRRKALKRNQSDSPADKTTIVRLIANTASSNYYHLKDKMRAFTKEQDPKIEVIKRSSNYRLFRADNYEGLREICDKFYTNWCTITSISGDEFEKYRERYGENYVLYLPKIGRAISIHANPNSFLITGHGNQYELVSAIIADEALDEFKYELKSSQITDNERNELAQFFSRAVGNTRLGNLFN